MARLIRVTIGLGAGGTLHDRTVLDDARLTDVATGGRAAIVVNNIALTDAITRVVSRVRAVSDNMAITDVVPIVKTGAPTAPLTLTRTDIQNTSVRLNWTASDDPTVTKQAIYQGNTLLVDNISALARQYDWTGLLPNTAYNNINVRRFNAQGWSPASPSVSFTTTNTQTGGALFLGHVPGKIYFGWSTSHTETAAETQLNTQTPLPSGSPNYSSILGVRRLYNKNQTTISHTDQNNRVLWISAKPGDFGASGAIPGGWNNIANGQHDSQIVSYFNSLVSRNKLTVFTFHHEPIGDTTNPNTDGVSYCNAARRIMQVVDQNYPGHRILFVPNYEENRLRNVRVNGILVNWASWLPENMLPGRGGPRPFDFISFDMYQYGPENTSTNSRAGVQFSHRWWRIDELFTGDFTPNGTTPMPYMTFTPGVDMVYGIGECSSRPGAFYWWENGGGTSTSNMTGAKYARDMLDYIFNNKEKYAFVSWFNSIGADLTYNDERLWPGTNTWGGKTPNHPSFVTQTGDTEITLNIYREKLRSGNTVKLGSNGLPAV